jgi:PilZ domain-containing protein
MVSSGIHLIESSWIHLTVSSREEGVCLLAVRTALLALGLPSSTSMAQGQSGRLYPRRRHSATCWFTWQERQFLGTIINVSYAGLALSLSGEAELGGEGEVIIQIPIHAPKPVTLRAHQVYCHRQQGENKRVGFKLASIESGEEHWHALCYAPRW